MAWQWLIKRLTLQRAQASAPEESSRTNSSFLEAASGRGIASSVQAVGLEKSEPSAQSPQSALSGDPFATGLEEFPARPSHPSERTSESVSSPPAHLPELPPQATPLHAEATPLPAGKAQGTKPAQPEPPLQTLQPPWLLRRTDQLLLAALLLLAGLGMLLWARGQAGPEGRLIDIDQASPLTADFRVDINQASWPELTQLPGIGPTLARRIVEYRLMHGPFRCLKEVEKVRGIGPKKLQQIKPYLLPLPEQRPPQSPKPPSENSPKDVLETSGGGSSA